MLPGFTIASTAWGATMRRYWAPACAGATTDVYFTLFVVNFTRVIPA